MWSSKYYIIYLLVLLWSVSNYYNISSPLTEVSIFCIYWCTPSSRTVPGPYRQSVKRFVNGWMGIIKNISLKKREEFLIPKRIPWILNAPHSNYLGTSTTACSKLSQTPRPFWSVSLTQKSFFSICEPYHLFHFSSIQSMQSRLLKLPTRVHLSLA